MLKSRIKRHLPSAARIKALPLFRYLGSRMKTRFGEPALWAVNCNAISRAVAIGLFCAYLPMPLEMLPATLLALAWRANLPLSIALVWLSNPFTWILLYAPPYLLGAALLGETSLSLSHITVAAMAQYVVALWLGCLIFGTTLGCAAYFAVRITWRMIVRNTRNKPRRRPSRPT